MTVYQTITYGANNNMPNEKTPLLNKEQTVNYNYSFQNLPKDALITIVSFLELKDVINFSEVNKTIQKKITTSEFLSKYPIMRVALDEEKGLKEEPLNDDKAPKASWQKIFSSLKNKNQLKAKFEKGQQQLGRCNCDVCTVSKIGYSSGGVLCAGYFVGFSLVGGKCVSLKIMWPYLLGTVSSGIACLVCALASVNYGCDSASPCKPNTEKKLKIENMLSFFNKTPKDENTVKERGIPIIDKEGDFIYPENKYPERFTMN